VRACFVVEEPDWSGAARAFADGAALLRAHGYETCLVAPPASESERVLRALGHDVIGLDSSGGWLRRGWRLRRVIMARLTEVVFAQGDRAHLTAAAGVRLAGRGAVVRRNPSGERLALGADGRFAARLAATAYLFAHPDDARGVEPPRGALAAHVAPPGVAAATPGPGRAPATVGAIQPDGQHVVLIAGADRRRDVLVALRALSLLAARLPALRATICTPLPDADAARLEAAALGIGARVEWRPAGSVRADLFDGVALAWVIASADEAAFGILDALASGVPVLAERGPVSARFVEHGVSGLLRHRADDAEWASAIAEFLTLAERAESLRAGARRAATRWPADGGADGWLAVADAARDRTKWVA